MLLYTQRSYHAGRCHTCLVVHARRNSSTAGSTAATARSNRLMPAQRQPHRRHKAFELQDPLWFRGLVMHEGSPARRRARLLPRGGPETAAAHAGPGRLQRDAIRLVG